MANSFVKRLIKTGIVSGQNFNEKRDIIFVNKITFGLILIMVCIFSANQFFGFHYRSLASVFAFCILIRVVFLQKNHQYFLAKTLVIATLLSTLTASTLLFGAEAMTHYHIFSSYCVSALFFKEKKYQNPLSFLHLGLFVFLHFYSKNYPPLFPGEDSGLLSYFHISVILFSGIYTLTEYISHYRRYENRISDLLLNLQEQAAILKLTNDKLQKEMEEKEAIQEQLLASNNALENFAYVASHDLKEPLRTIGGFTALIQQKNEGQFDQETQKYFQFVVDGSKRMTNLLDDLLAFSKLNGQVDISTIDLAHCLDINLLNLKNAIEKNKGTIIVGDLPRVQGNESQLIQLFQNLIANGLKFKREVEPLITIDCQEKTDHYLFSVKDNGIGIASKNIDKVFVIFHRLDNRNKFEGTGIGLSICKKIVQNHGGDIWIESTEGEGSTFFFTIAKSNQAWNKEALVHQTTESSLAPEETLSPAL